MIQMSGIIIGPVVSGYLYDKNGTYEAAFIGFAGAAVVSLVLVLMAFPPKTLQR
jgi:cyanate permease